MDGRVGVKHRVFAARSGELIGIINMRSIVIERDLAVPMRDGTCLFVNLFRPTADGSYPVIMSVTPYGKDKLRDCLTTFFMRLSGVKFGKLNCSRLTGFEAPDPVYWVQQGYIVLQADVRGMHKSEGQAGVLRQQDAEDYYDLIEWAAAQPWCTGRVGLLGVSYLAMSQWCVAALKPPHLYAIVPWEGVTDLYRELAFHGGIPETKFVSSGRESVFSVGTIAGFRWRKIS